MTTVWLVCTRAAQPFVPCQTGGCRFLNRAQPGFGLATINHAIVCEIPLVWEITRYLIVPRVTADLLSAHVGKAMHTGSMNCPPPNWLLQVTSGLRHLNREWVHFCAPKYR